MSGSIIHAIRKASHEDWTDIADTILTEQISMSQEESMDLRNRNAGVIFTGIKIFFENGHGGHRFYPNYQHVTPGSLGLWNQRETLGQREQCLWIPTNAQVTKVAPGEAKGCRAGAQPPLCL